MDRIRSRTEVWSFGQKSVEKRRSSYHVGNRKFGAIWWVSKSEMKGIFNTKTILNFSLRIICQHVYPSRFIKLLPEILAISPYILCIRFGSPYPELFLKVSFSWSSHNKNRRSIFSLKPYMQYLVWISFQVKRFVLHFKIIKLTIGWVFQ